ncbi:MAG: hypothetical protein A3G33_07795 [Omnitrophica bacterium RIFCSPLOWO2_12_FULL_44_17]|uniref:Putative 3-methyladenine DNA glycosylase n=1 Tax=Candidatus Danuiimicrobium aquiferis TaxID=1801832 RepID=A0A1G1L302_9BACT|nr:MAG: hypothetical protein A3B72_05580 [Omnitrophica bacterium RIFCSPHIGHO2_02_FULL_45_28]OGW99507.1 MAG: hypothetical protein A3G33_07795 [Omnitrophica bacterium RIFCSPLOWO2_12_FULL_44_17]OGX02680.1 MAG: hypothetical protein A3J12_06790 [Omnitrophica bacterium RIFCSPLOWO2_02_FULL_44_11]
MKYLDGSFFSRHTRIVAFELIGHELVFETLGGLLTGKIVETEAYFGANDPASHAYRGVTPRNRVMFGPAGKTYVYFTYGNHYCLNIVTEKEGVAGAVLIRALEPLGGIDMMRKNRRQINVNHMTNGPGKLTQAFGISREHSGMDLNTGSSLRIVESPSLEPVQIEVTPRIGISRAKKKLLRFCLKDNAFVSR